MNASISPKANMIIRRAMKHRLGIDDELAAKIEIAIREEAASFKMKVVASRVKFDNAGHSLARIRSAS